MDERGIKDSLIAGEQERLCELVRGALEDGDSAKAILDVMIEGMSVVGDRFQRKEIFIPEVLLSARAMTSATDILKPILAKSGSKPFGKVIIGTVLGDLHDIGKNIVGMMLEGNGFEVINLGRDVAPEKFVETAKESGARVIGLSSLVTTSMPQMRRTIDLLRQEGLDGSVAVMVGGAPVTQEFADSIGADGYADDAPGAVQKAKEFLQVEQ